MTFEEGKTLFEAQKFAEAKETFAAALKAAGDDAAAAKKIRMWIRKCDTHLSDTNMATTSAPAPTPAGEATANTATATAAPSAPAPTPAPAAVKAPTPKPLVRHDWFQTATHITLSFFVRNRKPEDVTVDVTDTSLDLVVKLDEGKEFQASFDPFYAAVDASSLKTDIRAPKVELTLAKKQPTQWAKLEGTPATDGAPAATAAAVPSSQKELPNPNSKGTNWSKFKLSEEDAKDDGDGTQIFFKQIYSGATDEQRRAMMKSFQESGGTVLSTNWEDIGSRTVECEAPKGMEKRKWGE